ncbi:MAG TPA: cytochrome c maturation protein CcmE [Flavisolibacter sp.]|nr:cytochrome c maturation protein CcmE [Flavisolibacter sp.]
MKNLHIILLIAIVAAIALLASFMGDLSTYDTVTSARKKQGRFVHLIAKLDHSNPVEYDAVKNPNYLSFYAVDSLGAVVKVVYHNAKPDNLEISERLVLKGSMKDDHFECKEIMMKCPSKYKDDPAQSEKNLSRSLSN